MKTTQERAAAGSSGKGDEEEEDAEDDATFLLAAAAPDLDRWATMVAPMAAPARAALTATIAIDLLSVVMVAVKTLFTLSLMGGLNCLAQREEEEEVVFCQSEDSMGGSTSGPLFFYQLRRALPFLSASLEVFCSRIFTQIRPFRKDRGT